MIERAPERPRDGRPSADDGVSSASATLLLLLAAPNRYGPSTSIAGITRLMKLLFLAEREAGFGGPDNFAFAPYKYGPFAADLYDALRALNERGLVEIASNRQPDYYQARELDELGDQHVRDAAERLARSQSSLAPSTQWVIALTPRGTELAATLAARVGQERVKRLADIKGRYGHLPLNELLAYVYRQYPETAQNSVHPLAGSRPHASG